MADMSTKIQVAARWATATVLDIHPDEGEMGWGCTCGARHEDDYTFFILSDVINAMDVHLTHQCAMRPSEING